MSDKIFGFPMENIPKQNSRFVIQIMACGNYRVAQFASNAIHFMPFHQAAHRAEFFSSTLSPAGHFRYCFSIDTGYIQDMQFHFGEDVPRKFFYILTRSFRIAALCIYPQVHIQPIGLEAQFQ